MSSESRCGHHPCLLWVLCVQGSGALGEYPAAGQAALLTGQMPPVPRMKSQVQAQAMLVVGALPCSPTAAPSPPGTARGVPRGTGQPAGWGAGAELLVSAISREHCSVTDQLGWGPFLLRTQRLCKFPAVLPGATSARLVWLSTHLSRGVQPGVSRDNPFGKGEPLPITGTA